MTCHVCNGSGMVRLPSKRVVKEVDSGYINAIGVVAYRKEEIEETIGGVDICPTCLSNAEAEYQIAKMEK